MHCLRTVSAIIYAENTQLMQQLIANLPSNAARLKEIATRLIKENAQLRGDLAIQQQKVQMAKQSMAELQNLAENPLFQQSLCSEQNKQLHAQLERMMRTEREARERIIVLERQLMDQKQEFEAKFLLLQQDSIQQVQSAAQLNAIVESEKIHLRSFFQVICDTLAIKCTDNAQQAELEALGEIQELRKSLQDKQNQIYQLQQQQDDFYDEKEALLGQIADLRNDEADQQKMDLIEKQIQELHAVLERLSAENVQLKDDNQKYAASAQERQERVSSLEQQLRAFELSAHLIEPMSQEISQLKQQLEDRKQQINLLEQENQLVRQENAQLQIQNSAQDAKVNAVAHENDILHAKINNCQESISALGSRVSQLDEHVQNLPDATLVKAKLTETTTSQGAQPNESTGAQLMASSCASVQIQTDVMAASLSLDRIVSDMLATSQNEDRMRMSGSLNHFETKSEDEESEHTLEPLRFSTQTQRTELGVVDFLAQKHKDLFNRVMQKRLLKEKK